MEYRRTNNDDVDLEEKLAVWERFYNSDRPHGTHGGTTPYESLRELLLAELFARNSILFL